MAVVNSMKRDVKLVYLERQTLIPLVNRWQRCSLQYRCESCSLVNNKMHFWRRKETRTQRSVLHWGWKQRHQMKNVCSMHFEKNFLRRSSIQMETIKLLTNVAWTMQVFHIQNCSFLWTSAWTFHEMICASTFLYREIVYRCTNAHNRELFHVVHFIVVAS